MLPIWLDTNVLRRWNLRLKTQEADKFFKIMQSWDFRVLIPSVVFEELIQHYVREALDQLPKIETLRPKLQSLEIPTIQGPWVNAPPNLESHYRELLTARCGERSIEIIPVSQISAERLLGLSVRRTPPFQGKEGERGFRDALILFSMLEHTKKSKLTDLFLISDDGIFEENEVSVLATEYGIRLFVYKSVDDFIRSLNAQVDAYVRKVQEKKEDRVRDFLIAQKSQIQEFIERTGEFDSRFLLDPLFGEVRKIVGISVDDIGTVSVFDVAGDTEGVRSLLVTFGVRLKVELEADRSWFIPPEPKRYRLGVEPEEPVHQFGPPRREVITVEREVDCEATAKEQIEQGTITDLDLKEVKTRVHSDSLIGGLPIPRPATQE